MRWSVGCVGFAGSVEEHLVIWVVGSVGCAGRVGCVGLLDALGLLRVLRSIW